MKHSETSEKGARFLLPAPRLQMNPETSLLCPLWHGTSSKRWLCSLGLVLVPDTSTVAPHPLPTDIQDKNFSAWIPTLIGSFCVCEMKIIVIATSRGGPKESQRMCL